jgi:hypothetical protein
MVVPTVITWGKFKAKLYVWLFLQSLHVVKLKLSCMYGCPYSHLPEVKLKLSCMYGCPYSHLPEVKLKLSCMHGCPYSCYLW